MNYATLFHTLAPEIAMVIGAFVLLGVDLVWLREKPVAQRTRILGIATAVFLGVIWMWLGARVWDAPLAAESAALLNGTLVVDSLAVFFKVVIVALTILTVLISIESEFTTHVGEYYALLIFGTLGMMFLITSEELIAIFCSLELLSLCLYILTAFHKSKRHSTEAGIKYYVFGALSSAFLLFGLSYLYGLTGESSLAGIGKALAATEWTPASRTILLLGLVFTVVGFGFKIAVVPFHLWAPDAYQGAPTPVTAFIATGSKVASFIVLLKVMVIALPGSLLQGAANWWPLGGAAELKTGWVSLLAFIAALSMILGNTAAIVQNNVKRLLAYSSIAHGGYILLGVLAANDLGQKSVLFYVIVYGLANIGAFGVVQALADKAGGDNFENFRGMARRAPFLSLMMLIFVLSLAGIPPLGGFFGKFYLFLAAAKAHNLGLLWLVILGIAMSAVSLYYYLILLKQMYVIEPEDSTPIKASIQFRFATAGAALFILLLGIFPGPVIALLDQLLKRSSLPM
jgi:NADH-quinone oxidoreductase subunit N